MTIALDYDDTFTRDPAFWTAVVDAGRKFGHKFVCITARRDTFDNRAELSNALPAGVDAYFSYDEPKSDFARRKGIVVDVWVDDLPGWIVGVT